MKPSDIMNAVIHAFESYYWEQDGTRLAEQVSPIERQTKWDSNRIRTNIFLDTAALSEVAYCVRFQGPPYLTALSISQVRSLLRDIVRDNFWRVGREGPARKTGRLQLDESHVEAVCAIFSSRIISPTPIRFLFPLTPLSVTQAFEFADWSLYPPSEMPRVLSGTARLDRLKPEEMPLFAESGIQGKPVGCWLEVRSPAPEHAQKLKRIVLGAIALCPLHRDRHQFTLRQNCDGYCYLSDGVWTVSSSPHMPPIGDLLLDTSDLAWLSHLAQITSSTKKEDNKKRNALEYYYNAWPLTKSERCPVYFSALEALIGVGTVKTTETLRSGIKRTLPQITSDDRLRSITDLRNSIVHGGAPDAYSSSNYRKYYNSYKADIIDDIELVTEECLRKLIFDGKFREQPDPHGELIAKFQGFGIFPSKDRSTSIV